MQDEIVADGLARVTEAAKWLGLGRTKVYELMDRGELPYCRLDGARRIPWRAVREYAAARLVRR